MKEIDFTCITNKQMNNIIKGYNRLKKKVKVEKQTNYFISSNDNIISQSNKNNINNIDYSNVHNWLMKE